MQRILIHGRSRSGTTITREILNRHPDIQIYNEELIYARTNDVNEIIKKEKKFYDNKSKFFGDKFGTPSIRQFKVNKSLNIKYIYIYRDGRDSVASGFRKNLGPNDKKIWRSKNLKLNSKDWADHYFRWEEAKRNIISDGYWCEIRFEDYIDNPSKNMHIISEFLGIDHKELVKFENQLINEDSSHKGYYSQLIPNWEKEFHPDAIEVLKILGYMER